MTALSNEAASLNLARKVATKEQFKGNMVNILTIWIRFIFISYILLGAGLPFYVPLSFCHLLCLPAQAFLGQAVSMDCSSYANTTHLVSGEAPDPFAELQLSDYLFSDDGFDLVDHSSSQSSMISPEKVAIGGPSTGYSSSAIPRHAIMKSKRGEKKSKSEAGHRVAFRTKSELEIMDDGFKWRKYGKKSVKNSPNPRNYYRCSSGGCNVKKRVERDREDSRYVITTYDGVHNHQNPFAAHNNQIPFEVSIDQWLLQASSPHDSFST